jgi:hypothetical protein
MLKAYDGWRIQCAPDSYGTLSLAILHEDADMGLRFASDGVRIKRANSASWELL